VADITLDGCGGWGRRPTTAPMAAATPLIDLRSGYGMVSLARGNSSVAQTVSVRCHPAV
jgi:hypothetical protein